MSDFLKFRYSALSCDQVQSQRAMLVQCSKAREEISKMIPYHFAVCFLCSYLFVLL